MNRWHPLHTAAIGKRIRQRRSVLDLTLKELGKRADLSEGQLSRYERGHFSLIRPEVASRLAKALQTPETSLVAEPDVSEASIGAGSPSAAAGLQPVAELPGRGTTGSQVESRLDGEATQALLQFMDVYLAAPAQDRQVLVRILERLSSLYRVDANLPAHLHEA